MESLLGFMEPSADETLEGNSLALKLVPWISWDEWNSIRDSLFSSSPQSVAFALQRISTWRSRGCIPVSVDVTASIIEIQQKDPFFRKDLGGNALQSEEMLSMLYCMAIMRLVNGVVEKTRKKAEISIAEAANAFGIPRMLIDVRHEGSHRDLPSLQLVRLASTKSLLGFMEPSADETLEGNSLALKLVPWISWDEWNSIRDSLFSSSPQSVAFALQRISTWRSRGCIPVSVDVTASIIEIQQKDPFFRKDLGGNALQSEEMLSMLYCMAIMRLVNGVVEKTRKKAEISIAEAANAFGIPRMLIDVRHEGSHRDLPSLQLVRLASTKALDWLKSYYWEPQKNVIRRDSTANLRKEIKHKLLEMAFCLKVKQTNSSHTSGKRMRLGQLCARNKFLPFISGNLPYSKTSGSKKQITRAMKVILRLYTSSSSEVASVLLELMLQTVDSSNFPGDSENAPTIHETIDMHSAYDDWKPILKKLSNREPDLLPTLLRAALDKIETMGASKHQLGANALSGNANESLLIGQLSYLCEQIVANLKTLKPLNINDLAADREDSSRKLSLPEATLQELLHKCLFLSSNNNNQLMKSALVIAQMIGRNSFIDKLNKLCSLSAFDSEIIHSDPSTNNSEGFLLSREEDSLRKAAQKLELIMRRVVKGNNMNTTDTGSQWVVAKTWKACPIGMLPHAFGSTGRLPIFDFVDDSAEVAKSSDNEIPETDKCGCKREAASAIECLDDPNTKKMRKTEEPGDNQYTKNMKIENGHNDVPLEGSKGHLMIDGVWKKVSMEELRDIAAAVKIFDLTKTL